MSEAERKIARSVISGQFREFFKAPYRKYKERKVRDLKFALRIKRGFVYREKDEELLNGINYVVSILAKRSTYGRR